VNKQSLQFYAQRAFSCLDLTSLNDDDTEVEIAALCARASGPWGSVAAVCVWPKWVALARSLLKTQVPVAAVANFPSGNGEAGIVLKEMETIIQGGAQEIDVVLPYRRLIEGDERFVSEFLEKVRVACPGLTLKVILETGELTHPALIARAASVSLDAGADFLKTSTGKTRVGATTAAARTMLEAIKQDVRYADRRGFKASGGIRRMSDAIVYMDLVAEILGPQAVDPSRFRLGASSLLDDVLRILDLSLIHI